MGGVLCVGRVVLVESAGVLGWGFMDATSTTITMVATSKNLICFIVVLLFGKCGTSTF